MRKIIITSNISLDGVMQAPHGSGEDTSGGFRYGGWTSAHSDKESGKAVQKEMNQPVDYLLGRKTYELFAAFWPENAKMWPGINEGTKYVLSNTLTRSDWKNTLFLDSIDAIRKVKNSEGPDLQVWGSSQLVHLLLENDLVDELHLRIFPVLLGNGKKLFSDGTVPTAFTLVDNFVTPKGLIIANYQRSGNLTPAIPADVLINQYLKS